MRHSYPPHSLSEVVGEGLISDGDWIESKDQDANGEVRLIQLADIGDGRYINKSNRFLTKATASRLKCTPLLKGDIIIARMPDPIGRACIFPGDIKEAITVVDVCILRVNQRTTDAGWLMSVINADFTRRAIEKAAGGTTRTRISRGSLEKLVLPTPSLLEQQEIAAILAAVDEKLGLIARQIKATEVLKQGLMQTLFSRGVGLQDANGRWVPHVKFKDSAFGSIPENWNVETLGEICDGALQTGPFGSQLHAHEYQEDGVPVLMPKDLVNCRANLDTASKISHKRADELDRHRLNQGNLLFSRRGDVARFALIDEDSEGALCGTGCLKAIPGKAHHPAFIAHLLQLDVVRTWLEQNAVGQTMPNMNTGILASLPLVVSDNRAEQEKIADILDNVDAKAALLNKKQTTYQVLKRGLMQKLLTGEWRVKTDTKMAA